MRTRIQRWGNSLALRIPPSFAAESHIEDESEVELSLSDGKLVITPVVEHALLLDDLLAGITDENIHHEIDTGPAIGLEVW